MPSEKKRERQQRVRHEIGPTDDNDEKKKNKSLPEKIPDVTKKIEKEYNKGFESQNDISNKNLQDRNFKLPQLSKAPTIAYAEERQYEKVTIMKSASDEAKDKVPVKYQRRPVISNWLQYNEMPNSEDIEEGNDHLVGEDYSEVLKLNDSSCNGGFFYFKEENWWGKKDCDHLENHGLGAFKVTDLCAALATIPVHQVLKISENALPSHDLHQWNTSAETNKKSYEPDREYVPTEQLNNSLLEKLKLDAVASQPYNAIVSDNESMDSEDNELEYFSKDDLTIENLNKSTIEESEVTDEASSSTAKLSTNSFNFGLPSKTEVNKPVIKILKEISLPKLENKITEELKSLEIISDKPPSLESLVKEISGNSKETEELEDWLDSVLDD